jgi:hypothetical protein
MFSSIVYPLEAIPESDQATDVFGSSVRGLSYEKSVTTM